MQVLEDSMEEALVPSWAKPRQHVSAMEQLGSTVAPLAVDLLDLEEVLTAI